MALELVERVVELLVPLFGELQECFQHLLVSGDAGALEPRLDRIEHGSVTRKWPCVHQRQQELWIVAFELVKIRQDSDLVSHGKP
jgi:hypothetical protein